MELGPSIDETTAYFTVLSLAAAIMGTPTRNHWSDIFEMSRNAEK